MQYDCQDFAVADWLGYWQCFTRPCPPTGSQWPDYKNCRISTFVVYLLQLILQCIVAIM